MVINQKSRIQQLGTLKQKVVGLIQKFDNVPLEEVSKFLDEVEAFCQWSEGKLQLAFVEDLFQDLESSMYSVMNDEEDPKHLLALMQMMLKRVEKKEQEFMNAENEKNDIEENVTNEGVAQANNEELPKTVATKSYTCMEFLSKYKATFLRITSELKRELTLGSLSELKDALKSAQHHAWCLYLEDLNSYMNDTYKHVEWLISYDVTREELFSVLDGLNEKMAEQLKMLIEAEEEKATKEKLSKFMQECAMQLDFEQFDLNDEDIANIMNSLVAVCSFIISKKKN